MGEIVLEENWDKKNLRSYITLWLKGCNYEGNLSCLMGFLDQTLNSSLRGMM